MSNRTWLITGVSSGFGFEMTKQLLEAGDTVVGTVRSTTKVKNLIDRYPATFDCVLLDVTDVPAVQKTVADAFAKHDRVDVIAVTRDTVCSAARKDCRTRRSTTLSPPT